MDSRIHIYGRRVFRALFLFVVVPYITLCGTLYFFQEELIFFPEKLDKNYVFNFGQNAEEIYTLSTDEKSLHGLLLSVPKPRGLIFYLHGNAGSVNTWGEVAKTYTDLQYDVYIHDYRGYGKSEGEITSQDQLFDDHQRVYEALKKRYSEESIVIIGYSLGTGFAAKLASVNNPKLLILQAPYYSLIDMMQQTYAFVPTFLLKYSLITHQYLESVRAPLVIFHGNCDEVVPYSSSLKLKSEFKLTDTLITLPGQ